MSICLVWSDQCVFDQAHCVISDQNELKDAKAAINRQKEVIQGLIVGWCPVFFLPEYFYSEKKTAGQRGSLWWHRINYIQIRSRQSQRHFHCLSTAIFSQSDESNTASWQKKATLGYTHFSWQLLGNSSQALLADVRVMFPIKHDPFSEVPN